MSENQHSNHVGPSGDAPPTLAPPSAGTGDSVRCPCECNEDDGLMIMCEICRSWQHGTCFLVLDDDSAPKVHICEICSVVSVSIISEEIL